MKLTTCVGVLLFISGVCLVQAQKKVEESSEQVAPAKSSDANPELDAIRKESEAFVIAFNNRDAKAVAALWTEDAEYVDEKGNTLSGRENIEKGYADLFEANPKAKISITIDSLRMLSDASAVEDGRAKVEPVAPGTTGVTQYTAFHVKVNGKWKMAAVRDTVVQAPVAYHSLTDLDWLIGSWVAEENGAKLKSTCRWIANNTFVERRYSATHLDGSKSEGLQIIGWNPYAGHIQSWDFSSDGGNAAGVWLPTEGGWRGELQGVAGDGSVTSAINYLIRLDDDAYVWRSTDRTRAGIALPEADEVVIRRALPVE